MDFTLCLNHLITNQTAIIYTIHRIVFSKLIFFDNFIKTNKNMRTILLIIPILFLFTISSCSDNDDDIPSTVESNTVTATIDGEIIKFSNLVITKQPYTNDETGFEWTDIRVLGYNTENTLNAIEFIAEEGLLGAESIWRFNITINGFTYVQDNSAFTTLVTESTENKLKGTFSGVLTEPNNGQTITISNGAFNVDH